MPYNIHFEAARKTHVAPLIFGTADKSNISKISNISNGKCLHSSIYSDFRMFLLLLLLPSVFTLDNGLAKTPPMGW